MNVDQATVHTRRGDTIVVSLFEGGGEEPSLLLSVTDPDRTPVPTAELSVTEAAELREIMRGFCERAVRGPRWTTRR